MMEGGILAAARGPHPFAGVAVARHRVDTVEAQHGANSFTMFCGLKGDAPPALRSGFRTAAHAAVNGPCV
jgi:hypothetical protein